MSAPFNLTNALCAERQLFLNYTSFIPKTRTEVVSPYPQYTQDQLNMRRKVEILKYNNNRQPSLTNNFTKKKQWAQLNRKTSLKSQTLEACPERIQPMLTTSSDVPGPPIYLLEDTTVPLYNYATVDNRQIPIVPDSNNETVPIIAEIVSDVVAKSETIFTVCDLVIINPVNSLTTFQFQTPLALNFSGNKMISLSALTIISRIKVEIANISCTTYYLGSPVQNSLLPTPIAQLRDTNGGFMMIDLLNTSNGYFSASQYIGNLTVSSLGLITQPGMIYTVKLAFTLKYALLGKNSDVPILSKSNIFDIALGSTVNLPDTNDPYYQTVSNCTLLSNTGANFAPFSLTF